MSGEKGRVESYDLDDIWLASAGDDRIGWVSTVCHYSLFIDMTDSTSLYIRNIMT